MGMWPTATLTYGFDIEDATGNWYENDEPVKAGGQVLRDAGFPDSFGIWQDFDGCRMRLYAAFLQASGYNDKGEAESLALPDGTGRQLRSAAKLLGINIDNAKFGWLLVGEFN